MRDCFIHLLIPMDDSNVGRFDLLTCSHSGIKSVVLLQVFLKAGHSIHLYTTLTSP